MTTETFAALALDAIASSLTNPRKHFDPVKLQELADSIAASGVHQPILVRPLPASRLADTAMLNPRPTHEVVAGERRLHASRLAKQPTIPAMIRELTDYQVFEIQIIENLHRDDLSALEEAEGYAALMAHNNIRAEDVAGKINKSRTYIFNRLKLLDLHPTSRQALREGKLDHSSALLIARVPDSTLQAKALEYATKPNSQGDTPSVRDLQTWLVQNVMLRLDHATFSITSATLCADAGSCTDCAKRTGANPDLFADVASADVCTDPPCFHAKADAHRSTMIARAERKGMRFIEGKEAKEIVSQYSSELKGYSRIDQKRNDADGSSLKDLLGKDMVGAVLIESPFGRKELIEAVPTQQAEEALLAKGLIKTMPVDSRKASALEQDIEQLKENKTKEILKNTHIAQFETLLGNVRATPDNVAPRLITADVLRAWLTAFMINSMQTLNIYEVLNMPYDHATSNDEEALLRLNAASDADVYRYAATFFLKEDAEQNWWRVTEAPATIVFDAIAKLPIINIDLERIKAEAKEDVETNTKAQLNELKKQLKAAQNASLPDPPLAQHKPTRGKMKEGAELPTESAAQEPPAAQAQPKSAQLRKPKTSAQDAKAGIAAAMQNLEAAPLGAALGGAEVAGNKKWIGGIPKGTDVEIVFGQHFGKRGILKNAVSANVYDVTTGTGDQATSHRLSVNQFEVVRA